MSASTRQRGQSLVLVTMALPVVFGFAALVVDLGWAYYRREAAQAAAEAAATAAARAASVSSPSAMVCNAQKVACGAYTCPAKAPTTMSNSLDNACAMAAANGFVTAGRQSVTLQAGVNSSPPTAPTVTASYWVVARVSERAVGFFGSLVGNPLTPSARSTAAVVVQNPSGAGCIYVLNPHAQDAFLAANGAQVTTGCGIYVNSDGKAVSPAKAAMHITGGSKVNVSGASITVVGAEQEDNGGSHSGTVTQNTGKPVDDPLAKLTPPPLGNCLPSGTGNMNAWKGTPYTPPAGTYCDGFNLGNGNSAVLSPGIYIINGGTFSILSGHVTATGGVMIYLTNGATATIANGTKVTLSAQTTGDYQGILFYSSRAYTPGASSFAGGATMNLSGSLYFPTSTLNIDNGTNTTGTKMAIVADKVNFQGGAKITASTSIADTGIDPGGGAGVFTIE